MGKVSNMILEIQDLLISGFDAEQISRRLDIPTQWVYEAAEMAEEQHFEDYMDGDHDSAMASAGFGTDEDYGYYGEDY
jgi:hypothetical protein